MSGSVHSLLIRGKKGVDLKMPYLLSVSLDDSHLCSPFVGSGHPKWFSVMRTPECLLPTYFTKVWESLSTRTEQNLRKQGLDKFVIFIYN